MPLKFLFIENRDKTLFWRELALELKERGYEISWLVQNPIYCPQSHNNSNIHIIPFPKSKNIINNNYDNKWIEENYPYLISDRGRKYFKTGTSHYEHYKKEIDKILDNESPNFVIGEPTLFHELITAHLCKSKGIIFAHPCATRFPSGRFSIFGFDSQEPLVNSYDCWPNDHVSEFVRLTALGINIPSYMLKPKKIENTARVLRLLKARTKNWLGFINGERYNTPSLRVKLFLTLQLKHNLKQWRSMESEPVNPNRTLLYPLQMQPEANIDVWGHPFSDQISLLKEMLKVSPDDVQVAVKANPKSKYEVSQDLLMLAKNEPRICLLPLNMTMNKAQQCTIGTLTVIGTVGYEAVFGKGRCISLQHPLIKKMFPSMHANSVPEAVDRLLYDPNSGVGSKEMGAQFIAELVNGSFPGQVGDPIYNPHCISTVNVRLVADGLQKLAKNIQPNSAI